MAEMLMNK